MNHIYLGFDRYSFTTERHFIDKFSMKTSYVKWFNQLNFLSGLWYFYYLDSGIIISVSSIMSVGHCVSEFICELLYCKLGYI